MVNQFFVSSSMQWVLHPTQATERLLQAALTITQRKRGKRSQKHKSKINCLTAVCFWMSVLSLLRSLTFTNGSNWVSRTILHESSVWSALSIASTFTPSFFPSFSHPLSNCCYCFPSFSHLNTQRTSHTLTHIQIQRNLCDFFLLFFFFFLLSPYFYSSRFAIFFVSLFHLSPDPRYSECFCCAFFISVLFCFAFNPLHISKPSVAKGVKVKKFQSQRTEGWREKLTVLKEKREVKTWRKLQCVLDWYIVKHKWKEASCVRGKNWKVKRQSESKNRKTRRREQKKREKEKQFTGNSRL